MRDLTLPRFFCVAAVYVISIAPAVFLLCSSRCQQKVSLIHNRQSELRLMELRRRALTCELVQWLCSEAEGVFYFAPRGGRVSARGFLRNWVDFVRLMFCRWRTRSSKLWKHSTLAPDPGPGHGGNNAERPPP